MKDTKNKPDERINGNTEELEMEELCTHLGFEKEYNDPEKKPILEKLLEAKMDRIMNRLSDVHMILWGTYMEVIAEFSKMTADYTNDYVQAVVQLMYNDYCELIRSRDMLEAFTDKICMVGGMILPLGGETTSLCQKLCYGFGEQATNFVVQALTCFSGCDPDDEVWEKMIMSSLGNLNNNTVS